MKHKKLSIMLFYFCTFFACTNGNANQICTDCKAQCYQNVLKNHLEKFYSGAFKPLLTITQTEGMFPSLLINNKKKFELQYRYNSIEFIEIIEKAGLYRYFFQVNDNIIFLDIIPQKNNCALILEDTDIIRLLWREIELRYKIGNSLVEQDNYYEGNRWFIDSDLIKLTKEEAKEIPTISERAEKFKDGYEIPSKKEREIELKLLKKQAINGNIDAMNKLGSIYSPVNKIFGAEYPNDYDENAAVKWYSMAAKKGSKLAMNNLASIYDSLEEYDNAYILYKELFLVDKENYILYVAEFLKQGKGVPPNQELANTYYKEAFDLGLKHKDLAKNIASGYNFGFFGMEKNEAKAIRWYKIAAKLGSVSAVSSLESLKN